MASFEKFEPIFGEVVPESSDQGSGLLRRCLFHVYASDSFHLTVHVTDFVSGVWTTILSISQLDDMRDTVGIGGSWSEFLDYTVASLKSDNVKLLLGDNTVSNGVETARLVSQKTKGMPRVIIPLTKMVDSSSNEAMANLSLALFRAFKSKQHLQGEVSSSAAATDEKDKRDSTHNQLEQHFSGKLDAMAPSRLHSPGLSCLLFNHTTHKIFNITGNFWLQPSNLPEKLTQQNLLNEYLRTEETVNEVLFCRIQKKRMANRTLDCLGSYV